MVDLRVIPRIVDEHRFDLWAGSMHTAMSEARVSARIGDAHVELQPLARMWEGNDGPLASITPVDVEQHGLEPDTEYDIFISIDGGAEDRIGYVRTLPVVPGDRARPLRVLLASCFSRLADDASDASGLLSYLASKQALRPHFKVWCGDQVYLDSPWWRYAVTRHSAAELRTRHADHYAGTWFDDNGIGASLSEGANLFCPDDHELWNNAPFPTPLVRDTWQSQAQRRLWLDTARALYRGFQKADTAPQIFPAGGLSVCVMDTRMDRDVDLRTVITPANLLRVKTWIRDLAGPGLLVMGQILFAPAAGSLKGKLFDYSLQNYEQFDELAAALHASMQSIVVLTGDVHYSRVATTTLPSGATLAEVICSPLALVKGARGDWARAPDRMRLRSGGVLGTTIETNDEIRSEDQNVAMVQFFAEGSHFHMRVELWPTRRRSGAYAPVQSTELVL